MATLLLRTVGHLPAVGLDLDWVGPMGVANTPLRPLGILIEPVVLDSRAHVGPGVGLVGVCAWVRELVPPRMEQPGGRAIRLRKRVSQSVECLDGRAASHVRYGLRQRQRDQQHADRRQDPGFIRRARLGAGLPGLCRAEICHRDSHGWKKPGSSLGIAGRIAAGRRTGRSWQGRTPIWLLALGRCDRSGSGV